MQVLTAEETLAAIEKATAPLLKRIDELERMQKQWLDTDEACELIGVSRTTLETLRREKKIECEYEGRKPLYSRQSLQAYRESKPRLRINKEAA